MKINKNFIEFHKKSLIEDLEKANNVLNDLPLKCDFKNRYIEWIKQVELEEITDIDLAIWIENQYNYWNQKDKNYGIFLSYLLRKNEF